MRVQAVPKRVTGRLCLAVCTYFGEEITIWYRRYGAEYKNSYVTRFSSYPETNALKENEITYILHDGREDDSYSPYYYYNKNKFIINQHIRKDQQW